MTNPQGTTGVGRNMMGVDMKDLLHRGPDTDFLLTGSDIPHSHGVVLPSSAPGGVGRILADRGASGDMTNWRLLKGANLPKGAGHRSAGNGIYAWGGKRALDLALTLLSLPVTLPVMLLCALALVIEGGNPFYTQERLGQNGKRFRILKLRTMVRDADTCLQDYLERDAALKREWESTQKLKNDPRITPVGRILRVTSLDELPQLWNVIKGEMSLVGPRPMMTDQLPLYGDPRDYFDVKPGLTGLWQVSARNESTFAFRAAADSEYCRGLGLANDMKLIWRIFGVVAKGTGY
ncbi:sugar transferase [Phaeobacter sp. QD34_24]|uniref:sugar transferase n=3 Tax=unclassified Phaeobacter TaxID=2621772 RepID=UPI00237F3856|nr:sugar transferase [Phaeobacter sp. QD34_24]